MNPQPQWNPQIDRTRCTGCGDCIAVCPASALAQVDGRAKVVLPQACTYCADCEAICPTGAIGLPYQISFSQDYQIQENERH